MNVFTSQSPTDATSRVLSICRRSGLTPAELAWILAEIPDDSVSQYRSYLLGEVWPNIFSAYLSGGYPACAEPGVRPLLARALSGLLLPRHRRKAFLACCRRYCVRGQLAGSPHVCHIARSRHAARDGRPPQLGPPER